MPDVIDLPWPVFVMCISTTSSSSGFMIKLVRCKIFCDYFHFPAGLLECRSSFHTLIEAVNFSPVQQCHVFVCLCAWEAEL